MLLRHRWSVSPRRCESECKVARTCEHSRTRLDPPYDYDGWPELLLDLPATTAVLEAPTAIDPPFGWEVVRSKRYGRTHVVIAQRIAV